jgi:hypothetical protein
MMTNGALNVLIVILIAVCFWVFILWKNSRRLHEDINMVAQQHNLIRNDDSARKLCRALHLLNPKLTAGIDYVIRHDSKDQEPYIAEWMSESSQPTSDQIKRALIELSDANHEAKYAAMRRAEYPSIGEQLDAAYQARQGNTAKQAELDRKIREIKEKYPKTDDCI